jgi:hypothetical protein
MDGYNFQDENFFKDGFENLETFRLNKLEVIDFVNDIEKSFDKIIKFYFFGNEGIKTVRREKFESMVLAESWCSFQAKKNLLIQIVNDANCLTGSEKNDFSLSIKRISLSRNLFAHGHEFIKGDSLYISYSTDYSGSIKINDEYLDKLGAYCSQCTTLTSKISTFFKVNIYSELPEEAQ